MSQILLLIVTGLAMFLFAVTNLSKAIQSIIGAKANAWVEKFTSNTYSSVLVGVVVTAILDSSSAVIIITIVLVNSQVLTFRKAMGIVLGANIGTTIGTQIIALDIGKYSPILLITGIIVYLISSSNKIKNIAKVVLYFGLLFLGLYIMEYAVEPLKDKPFFSEWMKKTENPIMGALVGAIVTVLIQSSSATVGMAIILAKKGFLSVISGVAIMLGAELGTCADTLLATINGSRQALKTGLFHVTFNLFSIILGLILFYPFVELVKYISANASIERTISNAHMIFNILGVFIFFWTIPLFEKFLNRILPG